MESNSTVRAGTPSVIAERYRVIAEIGRGNMGKVYCVEHLHTGDRLAMKVLLAHTGADSSTVSRFQREARALALIKSPHVVKIIDADIAEELGGAPFLVMELLEGCDLEHYLSERGKLTEIETLAILEQLARALERAHAAGVVHRDLKPANVFLHQTSDGVIVKVLDFGISKAAVGAVPESSVTASGVMMGTPLYMPPEQAMGEHQKIAPGTDIWAVGMLAFHLLSGRSYWSTTSTAELMASILGGIRALPSEIAPQFSKPFDVWFARSCHRSVHLRFHSASEQILELAKALALPAPVFSAHTTLPLSADIKQTLVQNDSEGMERFAALTRRSAGEKRSSITTSGERRQVTGLFCRMGTSSLSAEEIDPEDLRDAIDAYNRTCEEVLDRVGRPLRQFMGDGLLIYFGYPRAHGDDAKRAVQAALDIVQAVHDIDARFRSERRIGVSVCVGIHTGMVVAGEDAAKPAGTGIIGQAPDLALQLEAHANSNQVLVSAATQRLIREAYACESVGKQALRGFAQPIELFAVQGKASATAQQTGDGARRGGLVGRSSELGILLDRAEQALSGTGQVVLVSGEPGIGKSRLIEALREDLRGQCEWLDCSCSPYFTNAALQPISEAFRKLLGLDPRASAAAQRANLVATLMPFRLPSHSLPLFEMALGIPPAEASVPLNMSPQRQKQATLETFTTLMLELSEKRPLVLFVEDLHWVDPSSLELLSMFIEHCSAANVLGVFTCRPEFVSPWGSRSNFTQLSLTRLSPKRTESMIRELLGGRELPANAMAQLQAKTDGIPLFIEELTRAVAESGALERMGSDAEARTFPELAIPATLRDSLTARLDRLGPAKSTAQLAATIGREFNYDLLANISPLDADALRSQLRRLIDDELIFQRGLFPKTLYSFKHSLIQEAAYESLLKKVRREAHAHIVAALKESFPELVATQPEVIAHHAEQAGLIAEAVQYLVGAGQQALQRSALRESISHLSHALSLISNLPAGNERLKLEVSVRTTLGVPLMFSKGYGAPEVEENYARALTIDNDLGGKQPLTVLWGLWIFHHVRGRYEAAYGISQQLLELANGTDDSDVSVCAHLAHGSTSLLLGKLADARKHLERTIELYNPNTHGYHSHVFGQDPGMFSQAMLSWTLWLLGYPDQARRAAQASLDIARRAMHPNTLGFALSLKAALHQHCGEARLVLEHTEELLKLCAEQGLAHWGGLGQMLHGWARIQCAGEAEADSAVQEMLAGRRTWQAIGARVADTHWESMLAEVHARASRPALGQDILEHSFAFMAQSNERYFEPELQRLKGEFALRTTNDVGFAKAQFEKALELANRSGAKSLALRAALSLYELELRLGNGSDARITLGACLEGFSEGFDTQDLGRAAGLLSSAKSASQ